MRALANLASSLESLGGLEGAVLRGTLAMAAEMANAVALRAPAPILIPRPPGDGAFDLALDRIADMLKGDDGQAWKEAEKFLARRRPQETTR